MTLEDTIARDLAALGADNRRELPALDELRALRRTDVYRDDRHGAEARRDALANQRRRELALMPLGFAQVYAHRVARIAAGGMALVTAACMIAVLADHEIAFGIAARFVPGLPALSLVLLAGFGVLATYIIAQQIAERAFERELRAAITLSGDTYADLDHLARAPLELATAKLHKLDRAAVGVVFAGLTSMILALGFALGATSLDSGRLFAGSLLDIAATDLLAPFLDELGVFLIMVCGAGFVLACGVGRESGLLARLVRLAGHWSMLVVAGIAGFAALIHTTDELATRRHADPTSMIVLWTLAVVPAVLWAVLFVRRREHARLDLG